MLYKLWVSFVAAKNNLLALSEPFLLVKLNEGLKALLSKFEILCRANADNSCKRSGSGGVLKWR